MQQAAQRKSIRGAESLAGKYRLIAELGQGGMATVFLAVMMGNSGFRKLAVVKLLRREMADDADFVQMFLDEAKLCARLSHPNIVHTYDVGVDEFGHLMAMEYLDGVSLHAAIARMRKSGSPLKFPMQARVLLDVLEGLHYAHSLKDYDGSSLAIVHRDVTPQNIFVTYDGQVKLLDFGIAKAATSSTHTATGVIKGKLTYMAPEQARGDLVDARADLYAIGVMLWEAITGRRRWPSGLSEPALYARLAAGEPPDAPGAALLGYPAELDDLVLKSLATNVADRFQTAAEFHDALERVMRSMEPVSLRELGTVLATAFAEGRERLRTVIEEQFRLIEAGGPPSEPMLLPAVMSPGRVTGSQTFDRPIETNRRAEAQEAPTQRPTASAAKRRLTDLAAASDVELEGAPAPSALIPSVPVEIGTWWQGRPAVRHGVVAGLALAALVAAVFAMRAQPTSTPQPLPSTAPIDEAARASTQVTPAASANDPQRAVVGDDRPPSPDNAQRSGAGRRAEARPRVAAPAPRTNAGAAAEPVAVSPAASAVTTAAVDNASPPPLRGPTKPKVQLERDNPWP